MYHEEEPGLLNIPYEQLVQVVDPVVEAYVLEAHWVQEETPIEEEYVPTGHELHNVCPWLGW